MFDISFIILSLFSVNRIRESPQNFFRKWMATVTNMLSPTVEQATPNESVDYCTRYAAATVLAIPLLLDCNKPTRRTTGIKIQELNKAKEFLLNPSNDRQESKEVCDRISLQFFYIYSIFL